VTADSWSFDRVDHTELRSVLEASGFRPPPGFKAFVARISLTHGTPSYQLADYAGTSADRDDWWPASTVKVFAAAAALETVRSLGFTPRARVTFHYPRRPEAHTVEDLVRRAITHSDNAAFDQLVEIVGGDEMNAWLERRGFRSTVLLRGYSRRYVDPQTKRGILRISAALTLREPGRRSVRIRAREGMRRDGCRDQGNCTTLFDLSDALRRVMLHEVLPEPERFALGDAEISLLRSALSGPRERGLGVVKGLREAFAPREIVCYHKPGFALDWFSDHVFVEVAGSGADTPRYLIAMAAHGGRDVLDEAARVVGGLVASGRLAANRVPEKADSTSGRSGTSAPRPRCPTP